jgi:hypothetical protein
MATGSDALVDQPAPFAATVKPVALKPMGGVALSPRIIEPRGIWPPTVIAGGGADEGARGSREPWAEGPSGVVSARVSRRRKRCMAGIRDE